MAIKIMLDAGHYGKTYNKGAVAGYYESETVWKIHTYLKPALEAYGFEVGVTRKNQDENPTPEQRGRMAKGYDLFLSLHTNALDDETLDRPYMICFLDVAGELAVKSKAAGHKLGAAIEKVIGTKQPYQIWQREYPGDRDKNGKQDDEYYGVLFGSRAVGAVGVLVEHTFHTNERSALWLMDDGNLKKLAQA
ncbi:MAG: N-acetylmuramoyl-L-alanine amidase, partial [Eubacteriales bacterium]